MSIDGKFNQQAHKAKNRLGNAISTRAASTRPRPTARRGAGVAAVGQQRDPGRGAEVRDRASVLRRRPAGRLLLPAGAVRDRCARRHRRTRRDVPRRRPVRRAGPRHRYSWSATSAATTTSTSSPRSCAVTTRTTSSTGSSEMESFDAGRVGFGAGTPVVFNETVHGPSSVTRLSTASALRFLGAHHRGREAGRVRCGPERERSDRRGELLRRRVADRVRSTGSTRTTRMSRCIRAGGCRCATRTLTSGCPHGATGATSGVASRRRQAPARHDAGRRHDHQLEQQAGRRLRPRTTPGATARWSATSCSADGRPARDALAGVGCRCDEQGRDAGPEVGEGDQRPAVGVRDRAAPNARVQRMVELLQDWRVQDRTGSTWTTTARSTTRRRPSRQGMDKDRRRGRWAGTRSQARATWPRS